MTDRDTEKHIPTLIRKEKKTKKSVKSHQFIKKHKAKEAAAQENKTCRNNDQGSSITVNGHLRW